MSDGTLSLRCLNGVWTVTKPDGSTLSIDPATYGWPEALAYAASTGLPLFVYGLGHQNPFQFTNYTLQIPAQVAGGIRAYGTVLSFNNSSQPGLQMDTYAYGLFSMGGGQVRYSGNGTGVLVKPVTGVPSAAQPTPVTTWLRQSDMDFGTIIATGGNPDSLLTLDCTGVNTTDQYLSSGIIANGIKFVGEAYGRAKHALRLVSPLNARQLVSQNYIRFYVESCLEEEIVIGSPAGQYDVGLSTNHYVGNPTHTLPPPSTMNPPPPAADPQCMVYTNASWSHFQLNSANNESGVALPSIFKFGPLANKNVVSTKQAFGGTVLAIDATGTNEFSFGSPVSSQPSNTIKTTGEPFTVKLFANTWTMIDRSWNIPNGSTATALLLYATDPMTVPLILTRRNSAGNYTAVVTQSITHAGGGWQSVPVNFAVPNDGLEYNVGVYTTGLNQTFVDYKARALIQNVQLSGTMSGITEEAPHAQWYVIPVGVILQ